MNAKMLPSVNATEKYTLNVKMPLQSVQQEKKYNIHECAIPCID